MSQIKTKMTRKKALAALGIAAAVAYATPTMLSLNGAHASGGGSGGGNGKARGAMIVSDATVKKECGDCHMAYPPRLLPSGAWSNMMNNLSNHFGEDASLDETTRRHIENYLVQNSSNRGDANTLRISEQRWFVSEHRGEVSRSQMQKAKTWANCQVCHPGAENGNFDDD